MTAERRHETELKAVGRMALEAASAPPDASIPNIIAEHVRLLTDALYVGVVEKKPKENRFVFSGMATKSGTPRLSITANEFEINTDEYKSLLAKVVVEYDDWPLPIAREICDKNRRVLEEKWGETHCQQIALIDAQHICGFICIAYPHGANMLSTSTGEALSHIAALVMRERDSQNEKQQLESRYKELTDLLPEVVFEMDLGGNLTFVNDAAFSIFGYERHDFASGIHVDDIVAEVDRERVHANMARVITGNSAGPKEYLLKRKDGAHVPALVSVNVMMRQSQPAGIRGIVIDLSTSKQAQREFAQLVAAIEQTAESIIITDSIARVIFVNPAFIKTTGFKTESIIGNLPTLLTENCDEGTDFSEMWHTLRNGDSWHGLISNQRPDGSVYTLDTTISPVRASDGTTSPLRSNSTRVSYSS